MDIVIAFIVVGFAAFYVLRGALFVFGKPAGDACSGCGTHCDLPSSSNPGAFDV
jgi:hypothetical protein